MMKGLQEQLQKSGRRLQQGASLVRPHGVPVQAVPPLTQLLNIINSGMTPDAADNGNADGATKDEDVAKKQVNGANNDEANGPPSSVSTDADAEKSVPVQEQSPVGLGKGLSSLDTKKQKSKPHEFFKTKGA
ncbi:clustered mitochondria protein-like [Trifolium medium]|uniref:Clustered mitochondria protein-like n=1 Tax=Trifolium medium TaxID=97028 RepID=A0A392R0A1_9FABA|nr:clustered mitochondria protein-like [Trifolium medium]